MCGLCGLINFNREYADEDIIRRMMLLQKHRGPDDDGVFIEKNIGLGFVRLSIIDLSIDGHQPMTSRDGRHVIIFNGEIFNYIELREELKNLDTGFLQNLIRKSFWLLISNGEESFHRLNGMWAFVIYDRDSGKLVASRDRYGIKPFIISMTATP